MTRAGLLLLMVAFGFGCGKTTEPEAEPPAAVEEEAPASQPVEPPAAEPEEPAWDRVEP